MVISRRVRLDLTPGNAGNIIDQLHLHQITQDGSPNGTREFRSETSPFSFETHLSSGSAETWVTVIVACIPPIRKLFVKDVTKHGRTDPFFTELNGIGRRYGSQNTAFTSESGRRGNPLSASAGVERHEPDNESWKMILSEGGIRIRNAGERRLMSDFNTRKRAETTADLTGRICAPLQQWSIRDGPFLSA